MDDRTDFIDCIRKGDGSATKILCNEEFADRAKAAAIRVSESDGSDVVLDLSGVFNDALPVVLDFLRRSEDMTFGVLIASVGGDLDTPSAWIRFLLTVIARDPRYCMHIAQNIGPLVKCMCSDTNRLFFKSNAHWREAIMHFVVLIWYIFGRTVVNSEESNDTKLNIVGTLLKHEGLHAPLYSGDFGGKSIVLILQRN